MNKNSMKYVPLIGALLSTPVFAESALTLYGGLDLTVQYKTNVSKSGRDTVTVGDSNAPDIADAGEGALTGSHWGLRGREDLNARTSVIFQLESGIVLGTGKSNQQGQLFGRQAFVGIEDQDMGRLTFGRQLGIATNFAFDFDPIGVGNYQSNEWQIYLTGVRFDNSIMYSKKLGAYTVNLQYSLGETQGNAARGRTTGFDVRYAEGALKAGGFAQRSVDAMGNDAVVLGGGLVYGLGSTSLYLDYTDVAYAPGFAMGANNSGEPLANTSFFMNNVGNPRKRRDRVTTLGVLYNFTPTTSLTIGHMFDNVKHATARGNGRMATSYLLLDYVLSKRTDVYLEVDRSTARGQAISGGGTSLTSPGALNGIGDGQTESVGVSIGVRHFF